MYHRRPHFEDDDARFDADAYRVAGHAGVAWHVLGWEVEPDEDTEWSGIEERTGKIVCVMVGDNRRFVFDSEDITPLSLENGDYCPGCGQIGCHCYA